MTALLNIHGALDIPAERITPASVPTIVRVYALIFFFLTEFMDWYVRRSTCQVLKCHSQDAYAEFHHLVHAIQRQAQELSGSPDAMDLDHRSDSTHSPRALWEESQLSQVGRQGHQRRIATQNSMTRRLIWEIQHDAEERTRIREQKDELLSRVLSATREQLHPVSEQNSGIVCMTTAAPDLGRTLPVEPNMPVKTNPSTQRSPNSNGPADLNVVLPALSSRPDPNTSRSSLIARIRLPTLNRM